MFDAVEMADGFSVYERKGYEPAALRIKWVCAFRR
jgi:hypothetical protein